MVDTKGRKTNSSIGLISLGGGLPSPEYFPIEQISAKFPTPPGFSPEATRESGTVKTAAKGDLKNGNSLYGKCYVSF